MEKMGLRFTQPTKTGDVATDKFRKNGGLAEAKHGKRGMKLANDSTTNMKSEGSQGGKLTQKKDDARVSSNGSSFPAQNVDIDLQKKGTKRA